MNNQSLITRLPRDLLTETLEFVGNKGWKPLYVRGTYDDANEFDYKIIKNADGSYHLIGVEDAQSFLIDDINHVVSMIADMVSGVATYGNNEKDYQFDCFYENGPEDTVFVSFTDGVAVIDDIIELMKELFNKLRILGVIRNSQ